MTAIQGIDKVLASHRRTCGVHVFSGDQKCTCGRDEAVADVASMRTDMQRAIYMLSCMADELGRVGRDDVIRMPGVVMRFAQALLDELKDRYEEQT